MHPVGARHYAALIAAFFLTLPATSQAHGGVVAENDLCIINIGYLRAHFKVYVPQVTGHREFCEDIPVRGESVFVMEYLHESLAMAPVAFRIIRNTTGKGTFARLADVKALPDIDAVTVRYEPPTVVPDVYTLLHEFAAEGEYIGIVTAGDAAAQERYTAVFPFEVGSTGAGVWPWFITALIVLQLQFWFWRRRNASATAALGALLFALSSGPAAGEDNTASSVNGHFSVTYSASIEPLEVNRMHSWSVAVFDADGQPVDGAAIRVEGGMPAHDHGLPTAPRAAPGDNPGFYRIEGLRFHMPGEWVLTLTIDDGHHADRVVIRFTV